MNSARQSAPQANGSAPRAESDLRSAFSLKPFSSTDYPEFNWSVSGPAEHGSRRWRRLFATRIEAEQFLAEKQRTEVRTTKRKRHRHFPRLARSRVAVGLALVLAISYSVDRLMRSSPTALPQGVLLMENFEHNPILDGWTTTDRGSDWTNREHASGHRSIVVDSGSWSSPFIPTTPGHFYRLKFSSKANTDPAPKAPPSGTCEIQFSTPRGQPLTPSVKLPFPSSTHWHLNEFHVQVPDAGHLPPLVNQLRMKIVFTSSGEELYIDDVTLEGTALETKSP